MKRLIHLAAGGIGCALFVFLFCIALLAVLGEGPEVLATSLYQTLFTGFGLGHALFYATPLIFTGLSFALATRAGLFNIGGEGQLYLGALGILVAQYLLPGLPAPLSLPFAILLSAIFGVAWGSIPGLMKAWRGSHEVIVTILLNFIGVSILSYAILYPFHSHDEQGPESFVLTANYQLPSFDSLFKMVGSDFFDSTPLNISLLLAIAVAFLVHFFLTRSVLGFELRAVGQNPKASRYAGISAEFHTWFALALAGGLAGLAATNDVMGYHHRVIEGFSPGYGFTGIAVALLVRNRALLIPFSAFLFGVLQNCSRELEFLSDKVTKELSVVIQAVIIIFVASLPSIQAAWRKRWGATRA